MNTFQIAFLEAIAVAVTVGCIMFIVATVAGAMSDSPLNEEVKDNTVD